jgi:hypothetical protein
VASDWKYNNDYLEPSVAYAFHVRVEEMIAEGDRDIDLVA